MRIFRRLARRDQDTQYAVRRLTRAARSGR
jgi:hypothetical protein